MSAAKLVVPCYNEAARLDGEAMLALVDARPDVELLFVDDGSTDATRARLEALRARRPQRVHLLALPRNQGKAEAVRQGLLAAMADRPALVGYFDADLSTPISEILRLLSLAEGRPVDVVMGARVALLGKEIHRSAVRHYLGRVFASVASQILRLRVYDTQCGAKLFRSSPSLAAALQSPFLSRWAFDVELLGRLLVGAPGVPGLEERAFLEVPLETWKDVPGSKLTGGAMAKALKDLALIAVDLRRRASAAGR